MRIRGLPFLVLVVGLALTGLLTWACFVAHDNNEDRLLHLQVRQAASVVSEAVPTIQTPLVSASQLAEATNGAPAQFTSSLKAYVGDRGPFSGAWLWNIGTSPPQLAASVGNGGVPSPPPPAPGSPSSLVVRGELHSSQPRIIYAVSPSPGSPWIVEAAAPLPKNRKLTVASNSAFGDINYALYLGRGADVSNLLASSVPVPITGRHAVVTVPFGTSALTLVGTPKTDLGGTLLARLGLVVAIVGVAISLGAAIVTDLLLRRERRAEDLAEENQRLYADQRSVAETLQRAMLPQSLPAIRGIETAARYIAGSEEIDVGGDWYDVTPLDRDRFLFALGDVSGRGVAAASLMARINHAMQAYSVEGESPSVIMNKAARFFGAQVDGTFATVVFGLVDVPNHEIRLVNAGHPPPLLLGDGISEFIDTVVNPPVGLSGVREFEATTIKVPSRATLVAFTDGLFEKRDEVLDVGLERVRMSAETSQGQGLESLLDDMVASAGTDGSDDRALLAIRWKD